MKPQPTGRIQSIDALRGLCVLLMCCHHFLFDLVAFLGAPWWLFTNPVLDALHYVFASCFVLLSGVSSRFSRSNVRRGGKVLALALALTLVTWAGDRLGERILGQSPGVLIQFGVLHMLGFCMLFYGLTRKLWDALPERLAPVLYLIAAAATFFLANGVRGVEQSWLFPIGLVREDFYSADFFPIFPWLFMFLLGTWLGRRIREGKLPEGFYRWSIPFFPAVGRHALLIYLLHQPALVGLTLLIGWLFGI